MGKPTESNLEGVAQQSDQSEGTPQVQTPEQPAGQDSGFTSVDLASIDRGSLPENLQPAYDSLAAMKESMQSDYTRKTQDIAEREKNIVALERDASAWQEVMRHPELSEAIYRVGSGREVNPAPSPAPQLPAAQPGIEDDPRAFIAGVVKEVLSEEIGPLRDSMGVVNQFVRRSQADLEFDNLAQRVPAALAVGKDRLSLIRGRRFNADGTQISMQDALGIALVENPDILTRAVSQTQPAGGSSQTQSVTLPQRPPAVEPSEQTSAGAGSVPATPPEGVKVIHEAIKAMKEKGLSVDSFADAGDRVIQQLRNKYGRP